MKIVNLKCPHCGGKLIRNGDSAKCESCEALFAIDYDESDVEYEKLKLQKAQIDKEQNDTNTDGKSGKKFVIFLIYLLKY